MFTVSHSLSFNFNPLSTRQAYLSATPASRIRHRFTTRRWLNLPSSAFGSSRFNNFISGCSITNTDLQLSDVIADVEVLQDSSAVVPDCSSPIVHIKSDILEPESLGLLSETTYVDHLLTGLTVLSEEEQNALAATPAHPNGLFGIFLAAVSIGPQILSCVKIPWPKMYLRLLNDHLPQKKLAEDCLMCALYACCLAGYLVEQLWNFAWPSAIALLHPSLLPVAVLGFFSKLAIIVGGPLVGKFMDNSPRLPSYISLNIVQAAAQLLSAAMIIHAYAVSPTSASSFLCRPWFAVLVLAGAIERLCGVASGVAVERDWIVLLAGINRPIALAQANAILNRIDLLCEIAGASIFGVLLSRCEPVTCLKFAAGLMICSLPVMIGLMWLTNKLSVGVLDQTKSMQTCCKDPSESSVQNANNIVGLSMETIKLGWKEYLQLPVLPASLAYVLLYFNVVLGPGSLMTAFLTQRGVNPSIIGGFSGLCSFMGVAATFLSATLVRRLGILKAGATGLVFQASLLAIAVGVYWSGSLSKQSSLIFLGLIVLSRLGHMSYDIVGAQILQTGIPSSKANLIGITEFSVASLAESMMLGVAIIANDASHFGFLALLSLLSVIGAAWMFCRWLLNPTDEQRSPFSFEPHF